MPPPAPSELAQALSGSAKPLSAAEAAALAAAFKAVDEGRWADARAAVANFSHPLLDRYRRLDASCAWRRRTDADFAATWRFLRESPDWPEPEVLRRQAEDRIGPEHAAVARSSATSPPSRRSPAPATCAAWRRRQAASPNDVPKFASDSWRNATFRNADENEFLNRYGQLPDAARTRSPASTASCATAAPQVARDLVAKLPPDYQPLANARLAMATRAADARDRAARRAGGQARRAGDQARARAWLRRTGNLDEAKALARQAGRQPDRRVVERAQPARARPAGRRPRRRRLCRRRAARPDQGRRLRRGRVPGRLDRAAPSQEDRPRRRSISRRCYDGVSTDISKSRAAYWLGRTHETAGRAKEANDWYGRAAGFGQTFYGQLAARKLPGGAAQLPSDPVATDADRQALGRPRAGRPWRAISARPATSSARGPSCCGSRAW